jgi:hypothetical protein
MYKAIISVKEKKETTLIFNNLLNKIMKEKEISTFNVYVEDYKELLSQIKSLLVNFNNKNSFVEISVREAHSNRFVTSYTMKHNGEIILNETYNIQDKKSFNNLSKREIEKRKFYSYNIREGLTRKEA